MKNLAALTALKLKLLLRRPLIMVFCIIIPILLSLLAGATVSKNNWSHVKAAYVDLARNGASEKLIRMFGESGFDWEERELATISRAIELSQLDGVIIIPETFGDLEAAITIDDAYTCKFVPGKNELAADTVHENFVVSVIALALEAKLSRDLLKMEGASSLSAEDLSRQLEEKTAEARAEGAILKLTVHDDGMETELPLIQVLITEFIKVKTS